MNLRNKMHAAALRGLPSVGQHRRKQANGTNKRVAPTGDADIEMATQSYSASRSQPIVTQTDCHGYDRTARKALPVATSDKSNPNSRLYALNTCYFWLEEDDERGRPHVQTSMKPDISRICRMYSCTELFTLSCGQMSVHRFPCRKTCVTNLPYSGKGVILRRTTSKTLRRWSRQPQRVTRWEMKR